MNLSDATERISHKIEAKGVTPDRQKIESRLKRLVEEFGVNPVEAERTVLNDLAREYKISTVAGGSQPQEKRQISEIVPGEWVTIEGRIMSLTTVPSPSIAQSGIIADASGAIRFIVWAKASAPLLEHGRWYRIESAIADEYRGTPGLKIHSGTTITPLDIDQPLMPTTVPITELKPGVGSIRAKVIQVWEPRHERVFQSGVLGDETGTMPFTIWKEEGKEKLEQNAVYNIYYASVDEYNGRLSLNLNSATWVDSSDEGDVEVNRNEMEATGAIVHVAPGSGLIKRCPVEGCNRTLSRQNYCPVHEIQPNFRYDLRLKAVLDDGTRARNVLIRCDLAQELGGITLDEAVRIAESNPLGMDEIFIRIRKAIFGRYYRCMGNEIDGRLLVNQCSKMSFNPEELASLLNRAGGETA